MFVIELSKLPQRLSLEDSPELSYKSLKFCDWITDADQWPVIGGSDHKNYDTAIKNPRDSLLDKPGISTCTLLSVFFFSRLSACL